MLCVAMKDFVGNGKKIVRNQLVEGDQFRNRDLLIDLRYIRTATADEIESATLEEDDEASSQPTKIPKPAVTAPKAKKVKKGKKLKAKKASSAD